MVKGDKAILISSKRTHFKVGTEVEICIVLGGLGMYFAKDINGFTQLVTESQLKKI